MWVLPLGSIWLVLLQTEIILKTKLKLFTYCAARASLRPCRAQGWYLVSKHHVFVCQIPSLNESIHPYIHPSMHPSIHPNMFVDPPQLTNIFAWMDGCMDAWMDAWMDACVDGWMDALNEGSP